MQISLSLSRS